MPRQSLMNGFGSIARTLVAHFAALFVVALQCACQTQTPDRPAVTEELDAQQTSGEEEGELHWGYEGDTGAENWGRLSPAFANCDTG